MKKAFTLAEVLITLTIIGVIAALTIPNLMQRYQEHVTVNKIKKFYSTLANAYTMAQKEYGIIDDDWTYEDIYENIFKPYFKIQKVCKNDFCGYSSIVRYLNSKHWGDFKGEKNHMMSIILDDGSYLWIGVHARKTIYYIVNTQKDSPQIWGKNFFSFGINDTKVFPAGETGGAASNLLDKISISTVNGNCLKANSVGNYCTPWVIYKGNMDYLHCDDLTWNGKNKCSK